MKINPSELPRCATSQGNLTVYKYVTQIKQPFPLNIQIPLIFLP